MKTISLTIAALFVLSSTACSFMEVEHKYEPGTPFSSYKSFRWTQATEATTEAKTDEVWDERIRGKISQELTKKGFNASATDQSDFLINYQFITQERVAVNQKDDMLRYANYRYANSLDVDTFSYRVGSLILDVIDPQSKEVVWQGHVYGFVDVHTDPKKQEKRLDKAIQMLLSKFPPN
jgi:hypothetical protein